VIDVVDFRRCIERARALLNLHDAPHSLTYRHALDKGVPVEYQNKYSLIQWIDRWTVDRASLILKDDLKTLDENETLFADVMYKLYSDFAKTISTTQEWYFSRGAIYETIFDYRYLSRFLPDNFNMLDFGPGCGRHAVAFHMTGNQGIYTGMECVEVLYMLQNAIMSYASPQKTVEYLDFILEGRGIPEISDAGPGALVHIPSWESGRVERNYFDVLIACHILDELPKGDFERLLNVAQKSLKTKGIIYARGTIRNPGKINLPNYHGFDIHDKFREIGFVPVVNDYYSSQLYNVIVWRREDD